MLTDFFSNSKNSDVLPRDLAVDQGGSIDNVRFAEVRHQDRIAARVRTLARDGVFQEARVWAINPFGLEIILPDTLRHVQVGEELQIDLIVFGQRSNFVGVILAVADEQSVERICTLRFVFESEVGRPRNNRRAPRWLCSENFYPVAVAPSPSYFDEWMYFQVRDVSKDGLQLTTSLRNKYLLPGTLVQLSVMFPASGNTSIGFRVRRVGVVSVGSKDLLLVGGEIEALSAEGKNIIGQYIIQFAPEVSIAELRGADFFPESLFRGATIRYVRSKQDYDRVLALRLEANEASGQLGSAAAVEDMIDADDSRSRILLATRGQDTIATIRIRFPDATSKLEAEKYLNWPVSLPRRDQVFEVSRLAIDAKYRGKDVLPSIFHFISLTAIAAERPWVTVSAMPKYVPFYLKVGFQRTNLVYRDERWSDELHVLIGHTLEAIKGRGTSPVYWYIMWSKVLENMQRDAVVQLTGIEKLRTRLYKVIGATMLAIGKR